jgi:SAM-dependent methyltransferase
VQQREADFHDEIAASIADRPPRPADHLERALLGSLGDIRGAAVLELGCGHGDLTMQLIDAGAKVVATDLSPGMVQAARQRIARHRPHAEARMVTASAEGSSLEDESFDLVVGKWIIHHVDVDAALRETARVLRPGGTAAFIENSGMNPVLRLARDRVVGRFGIPRLGTVDEHPLLAQDIELFRRVFDNVSLLWPDFYFVRLLDRQVFRQRWAALSRASKAVDDAVYRRLPRARRLSFHVIVIAQKAAVAQTSAATPHSSSIFPR